MIRAGWRLQGRKVIKGDPLPMGNVCAVGGEERGDASSHLELSEAGFKYLVITLMCLGLLFTGMQQLCINPGV